MIHDIQSVLKAFVSFIISVVGRGCNALAHDIAATARSSGDLKMTADVPAGLRPLMHSECNVPVELLFYSLSNKKMSMNTYFPNSKKLSVFLRIQDYFLHLKFEQAIY